MLRSISLPPFCGNESRVRTRLKYWIESAPKLWEARSRLYRSRFLQSNTRWKALAEIYKICIPLHRSDRKISAKKPSDFLRNWILNIQYFCVGSIWFCYFSVKFRWNFVGISRQISENNENYRDVDEKCGKNAEISRKFRNCWKISIRILNFSIVSLAAGHASRRREQTAPGRGAPALSHFEGSVLGFINEF